ncbi:hypothetical protein GCM10009569_02570 [Arthrobacter russicus]
MPGGVRRGNVGGFGQDPQPEPQFERRRHHHAGQLATAHHTNHWKSHKVKSSECACAERPPARRGGICAAGSQPIPGAARLAAARSRGPSWEVSWWLGGEGPGKE